MPHHHHDAINTASTYTWLVGTAASICSDAAGWVASWFTSSPALIAQATDVASSGGFALGMLGLATLFINRFYEDRRAERDERQRIRDHDNKLAELQSKLDQAVEDLAESRENRHREAKDWNRRLLEMQDRLADTRQAVKTNTAAVGILARQSGDDIPLAELHDTNGDMPTLP